MSMTRQLAAIAFTLFFALDSGSSFAAEPMASSPAHVVPAAGELQGASSGGIAVFKGIPYAAPPVGALRWQAPGPPPRWQGVRQATSFASACMQKP
ncbi:MAG: carboxylesterase family protein, partial [Caldimonas sp.]